MEQNKNLLKNIKMIILRHKAFLYFDLQVNTALTSFSVSSSTSRYFYLADSSS